MAEAEQQQQQAAEPPKAVKQKEVIASKVTGTVKWFNVKSGYGFINRNDTKEDVFVHQSAIIKNNPKKAVRSVGDGELVEFSVVVGEKGNEAANVTGPNGEPVRGSPYAADRRRNFRQWYYPRGGPRRGPRRPRDSQSEGEGGKDGATSGGEGGGGGNGGGGNGPPRRYRPRRGRGGYVGGGYYRGPYRGGPPGDQDQNGDAPRGRGPPRRYYRRNFRGGRGGPRRPHSQDSQGQAGEQGGQDGPRGQQRPRYRRRGPPRPRNSQSDSGNNYSKTTESTGPVKTEENQPVQNTTTESTA